MKKNLLTLGPWDSYTEYKAIWYQLFLHDAHICISGNGYCILQTRSDFSHSLGSYQCFANSSFYFTQLFSPELDNTKRKVFSEPALFHKVSRMTWHLFVKLKWIVIFLPHARGILKVVPALPFTGSINCNFSFLPRMLYRLCHLCACVHRWLLVNINTIKNGSSRVPGKS